MKKIEVIKNKLIRDDDELSRKVAYWNFLEKKIVFTYGCFDTINKDDIVYLSQAADFGDVLLIGLNSDSSIKKQGASTKPLNDERARSFVLGSLFFVYGVVVFDEETPLELIKSIQPQVLVKGYGCSDNKIVGSEVVKSYGGGVVTVNHVDEYSPSGS